ncbi:hypothetical protein D3C71_1120940 [compost metagenome]
MAGIDTYANAGFVFHTVDDRCQMFKFESQIAALTGGVFNDCRHALSLGQRNVDRLGDARQTGVFVDLHQMAAWMEVQQRQAKLLAALQFIKKRITGFFQRFFDRMAQVDEIAVMGKDLTRPETILFAGGFEIINHFSGERCRAPLTLIFGEQGESGRLDFGGANGGIRKTTCCAHVRSNVFHKGLLLTRNAYDSGLTGEGCSGLCHQAMNREVNRAPANNQPGEEHQRHQQRFCAGFFQCTHVSGHAQCRHRHRQ